ncbi:D-alanyl-D-alanine carboxypeptidase DacC [Halomicronema hongdechloris C2206]|uniref:D-alanyl-D-alanine carboxypeptidase DacC n=1 Tax=Halomicronema hongdechloris C2206 TaxID=1641165 RepID=A0A1Z3HTZ1_9CYAN|nr:D-alanyl-D-alanine carboxypeptidase [Halomicronema hongdechloris]ASC73763.1 D-alanyl-D-alanine carboxypeptidase DacC [Halomicronema hongdechloris C2206]
MVSRRVWDNPVFNVGLVSLLFGNVSAQPLRPTRLTSVELVPPWQQSAWVARLTAPDPAVEALVQSHVDQWIAQGLSASAQGIWIQTGDTVIAQHQGHVPLAAASLTKLATTLAALTTWDPTHGFTTRIGWTGPVENGVLRGDLIIQAGGDPLFVWEEAFALGNTMAEMGIRRIAGDLRIQGNFSMNFTADASRSGQLLRQAWMPSQWPAEARQQFATLPAGTAKPAIPIQGDVRVESMGQGDAADLWRLSHRSLPLVALLKAMNIYSNNVMADQMATAVGGPQALQQAVVAHAGVPAAEVRLVNGSGLGEANQLSARAVVAILQAIQDQLQADGFALPDVLPMAGQDQGTLSGRQLPGDAAVKTGSLAQVSSLAGIFSSQRRGWVWFAILNRGSDLETLRQQQDQLVLDVQAQWGQVPAGVAGQERVRLNQDPYRLGDPRRIQPL